MLLLRAPMAVVDWLGGYGTRAVAISLFLGLALPQLAATFKPFVPEAIFALLVLAFLRVEPQELENYFRRPKLIALATLWIMFAAPAILGLIFLALGLNEQSPALFLALIFQASSAPIMSAPAFAALMGLDAALSLATLLTCVAVTPIVAPLFAYLFVGENLGLSATELGLKLFLLLAGSASVAWFIRRAAGSARIARQQKRIDGLNVIILFVFAVAVMDGVATMLWWRPLFVLALIALTFLIALGAMGITLAIFLRAGQGRALALGWSAANRNMGLMLAATGGVLPDLTWLYFGLAQFPIYLLPQFLLPVARRLAPPEEKG